MGILLLELPELLFHCSRIVSEVVLNSILALHGGTIFDSFSIAKRIESVVTAATTWTNAS
jgi:hypothetical protein